MTDDDGFVWFALDVNPEPWAIGPVVTGRRGGKVYGNIGRNQQLYAYQQSIKEDLEAQQSGLWFEGPIELVFYFWRGRAAYTTHQSRTVRKHEADLTNLQKSTEDALQGVLFKNDKDVWKITSHMVLQGEDIHGKVLVGIRRASAIGDLPSDAAAALAELDSARFDNSIDEPEGF